MAKTIIAHFLEDRVLFLNGKQTFCTSRHVYRNGKKAERAEYKLPIHIFEALEEKKIVERKHKKKSKDNG